MDSLDTKKKVVLNQVFESNLNQFSFQSDTLAKIELQSYKANEMNYKSVSTIDQLAVFSEIYYEDGWNAYIDGQLVPHMRANYVLRSLLIPAGEHDIVFKFEPKVIATGNMISLISYGFLILIPLGWYLRERKKKVA